MTTTTRKNHPRGNRNDLRNPTNRRDIIIATTRKPSTAPDRRKNLLRPKTRRKRKRSVGALDRGPELHPRPTLPLLNIIIDTTPTTAPPIVERSRRPVLPPSPRGDYRRHRLVDARDRGRRGTMFARDAAIGRPDPDRPRQLQRLVHLQLYTNAI